MKTTAILLAFITAHAVSTVAQNTTQPLSWSDSTRDVYIDNEIDRQAQVLICDSPSRLALISPRLDRAVVLDINQHTLNTISRDSFHLAADRMSASSDAGEMKQIGKFTRIDGPIYSFAIDGKPVLIRNHPGSVGEMTREKLWETVPVWHAVTDGYRPASDTVAALKTCDKETNVTLFFGTWCPDSKNYIPRLIKALAEAANDKLKVKLVGIDNQFHEPVDTVQPRRITNVPTVVVERDGREIGRIVETPATSTIEADLAAILSGKQLVHEGRWDRGPKTANGVYSYVDQHGKTVGNEVWTLFSKSDGGYLIHSRITTKDLDTEVFQEVDGKRKPSFAEITRSHAGDRSRTRFTFSGTSLTARMRGSASGVITQTIELPERFFLFTPAVAARGWAPYDAQHVTLRTIEYLSPADFENAMGTLVPATSEAGGDEEVSVPAGKFIAKHVVIKTGDDICEMWVHSKLGIPVRLKTAGFEAVLSSLESSSH
jgi:thiol-disulfide isomerase/thioredoxin